MSHYGRWANLRGTWGWVPGPRAARAVYAPALVAFVGGSNFQLSISLGRGDAVTAMDFVEALFALQQACGVADLKMSDYGIRKGDMARYAASARTTMGGLFRFDPAPLTDADSEAILAASWR